MTKEEAKKLKAGRPGSKVWVRGDVRTMGDEALEIQFSTPYSIWIPVRDIVFTVKLEQERDALRSVLAEIYSTIDPCDESQMRLLEGPNCSELLDKLLAKERR